MRKVSAREKHVVVIVQLMKIKNDDIILTILMVVFLALAIVIQCAVDVTITITFS